MRSESKLVGTRLTSRWNKFSGPKKALRLAFWKVSTSLCHGVKPKSYPSAGMFDANVQKLQEVLFCMLLKRQLFGIVNNKGNLYHAWYKYVMNLFLECRWKDKLTGVTELITWMCFLPLTLHENIAIKAIATKEVRLIRTPKLSPPEKLITRFPL